MEHPTATNATNTTGTIRRTERILMSPFPPATALT
jgi:hypothetical protein